MELLAPAGNLEKLQYAYNWGADAAYIGLDGFSLRARADNFKQEDAPLISAFKKNKKLYCALNIVFKDSDIVALEEHIDDFKAFPFDAFIISDMGIIPIIRKHFPKAELHLSTQANCLNSEAAKFYRDLGFSRVIPSRELTLSGIEKMKHDVPDLEVEVFAHGAMCLAYSGRCFLSAWMTGRGSNDGSCAHSCRWDYRILEESKRPGEYYPIVHGKDFTLLLSSKDLCMIDYLKDLKNAGVDAIKIEGRMKSVYYTAVVSKAYRKALDRLEGLPAPDYEDARAELFSVSHRTYSTGFFYDKNDIEQPDPKLRVGEATFLGFIGKRLSEHMYEVRVVNHFKSGEKLECIAPDKERVSIEHYVLKGEYGEMLTQADHNKCCLLICDEELAEGQILRKFLQISDESAII